MTRFAPLALVALALLVGVAAFAPADAQDRGARRGAREAEDCPPAWAKTLLDEAKANAERDANRYQLVKHSDKKTVVFDRRTGRVTELTEDKQRESDPVGGRTVLRRATQLNESVGGVIRPR